MSELKSVGLALDLATRARDDAAQVLVRIQHGWRGAQDQLEQLESYAVDTELKWSVAAQVHAAPEIVRHYYQFMGRLQQAVALQRNATADLQQQVAAARQVLLNAEIRIASLNRLLAKKQSGIHRQRAGREQKLLDEFSAMQHRRLRAEAETLEAP